MAVLGASRHEAAGQQPPLTEETAFARAREAALTESAAAAVGLEAEAHQVDLRRPAEPVPWDQVDPLARAVAAAVRHSAVTLEPGGQLELSGVPAPDIGTAISWLQEDSTRARAAAAGLGVGLACAGADPLRPSRVGNPRPRYQAMAEHYAATGRAGPGAVMMASTAALQVNVQAGRCRQWPERVAAAHRLGPVMVAVSACSPWLHGRDTGWKSVRQRAWAQLGARACGPVPGCLGPGATAAADPASAWARYALRAPVVFTQTGPGKAAAVRATVPFADWASGSTRLGGRLPTAADLDVHLTTLFPPVRLRGYLELRYLDMCPPRWWPAVAAAVATLMDDPVAADLAAEATERSAGRWQAAARAGLGDPLLAAAARRCLEIAAERAPAGLAGAVGDLAALVESGRSPGDLLAVRIAEIGPHAALEELAHA